MLSLADGAKVQRKRQIKHTMPAVTVADRLRLLFVSLRLQVAVLGSQFLSPATTCDGSYNDMKPSFGIPWLGKLTVVCQQTQSRCSTQAWQSYNGALQASLAFNSTEICPQLADRMSAQAAGEASQSSQ